MRITESQLRRIVRRVISEAAGGNTRLYLSVDQDYKPLNQIIKELNSLGFTQVNDYDDGQLIEPQSSSYFDKKIWNITVTGDLKNFYKLVADGSLDFVVDAEVDGMSLDFKSLKKPSSERLRQSIDYMSSGQDRYDFSNPSTANMQFKVNTYVASESVEATKKLMSNSITKCGFKVLKYSGPAYTDYVTFLVSGDPLKFISALKSGKCPVEIPDPKMPDEVGIQMQSVDYINDQNMVQQFRIQGANMSSVFA
jgi:hypothetical protein